MFKYLRSINYSVLEKRCPCLVSLQEGLSGIKRFFQDGPTKVRTMRTPEILQPFEALLNQFDRLIDSVSNKSVEISAVETAINEASSADWDAAFEHYGYEIAEEWRDAWEPVCGHTTIHTGRFWAHKLGHEIHDEPFRCEGDAYGFALEHLQENEDPEELVEFFASRKEAE